MGNKSPITQINQDNSTTPKDAQSPETAPQKSTTTPNTVTTSPPKSVEPTLPPKPQPNSTEQPDNAPFKAELAAESSKSKISVFHLAGLQLAVKEGHLSQENADAIKAKVKEGALKSDAVDLILTAAFRDPEQFKKSFNTSSKGNIAAVLSDMDDEISKGLNSHSWSENKYYKPILEELVSIEKNGFAKQKTSDKPKAEETKPVKPTNAQTKPETTDQVQPESPDTKPAAKPQTKKTETASQPNTDYTLTSASKAVSDIGAKLIEMEKETPGADKIKPEMVKLAAESVEQLKKIDPSISDKDLFALGYYRLNLELQGRLPGKTPEERTKQFIAGVTRTEDSKNKAIKMGKNLAGKLQNELGRVKKESPIYDEAQEVIDIFEAAQ